MKRPLVSVTLVYVAGLLLGDHYQPSLLLLFATSFALAVGAIFFSDARRWIIWPLVLFTGWTNFVWHTAPISPHDLRLIQKEPAEIVAVRGRLRETPAHRVYVRNEQERFRSIVQLRVDQLQRRGAGWQAACGEVLATVPAMLPERFFAGQAVEITGVLAPPPTPLAEGLFDYRAYLRRQGVYYQLTTISTNDWRLSDAGCKRPIGDRFLTWARGTLARGLPEEDEALRLIWSMTLGWKPALTTEVYEPFMRSGTMHIFAISGLHIALIAGILVQVMRLFQVPRSWCGWVVILLIWFYTIATGWQPSAIRSTLMMSIIIFGWVLKRPSDLLNSLAAAAFIILLGDPQQMFGASFQLSFLVVLSIALLVPPLQALRDRLLRIDPLLPAELLPGWRRWLATPLRWLVDSLAVSLAAWVGALPVTAYYFHLFSPVTLAANLLIVPLSSFTLAANLGSLVCGAWCPWLSELFNCSGWLWMRCTIDLSNWATIIPKAYSYVRAPAGADMIAYYLVLLGLLAAWNMQSQLRRWSLLGAAAVTAFYPWPWQASPPPPSLTVIPVSGGMASFFQDPRQRVTWLMDCGPTNSLGFVTKPYLQANAVNSLSSLILTHGDLRHVGAAGQIAEGFRPQHIVVSPVRFRSSAYRKLVEQFEGVPDWLQRISSGAQFGSWTVLHPAEGNKFNRADDGALVVLGSFGGCRVLLLSDLGREGQDALLERSKELRADIVVTGLPTQGEPLNDALLDVIQPRLIVIADSEYPASERATPRLKERLAQRNVPVIYTRFAGAATIEFQASGWQARSMDGQRFVAAGRAGTREASRDRATANTGAP